MYGPYVDKEIAAKYNVKLVTLEELLKGSDIITVHAPLTKETKGMFGSEQFKIMKNNVIITPHSAFYSEQALKALQYKAVQEVIRGLTEKNPKSCVNPEVLK